MLLPPAPPPRADVVVIETTYGDRLHKPMDASIEEFYSAISDTLGRGGNVIIPTFALERAQELLFVLNQGDRKKPIEAVNAGLPRFAHGDFGDRDLCSSPRMLAARGRPAVPRAGVTRLRCPACISPAKGRNWWR